MNGWLGDFFHFWWGLLYWNARKEWFRRGRTRCPCQSRSDSGRAMETVCEAAAMWNKPARFRRVCPLLAQTPNGLRCSVNTPDVRPFWGRALAYYAGLALAFYLIGVLGVFTGMRLIGYNASLGMLAWPPSWHRLHEVRAKYFIAKAQKAYDEGRTNEGLISLSIAYNLDSSNYATGIQLASLWFLAGQYDMANTTFASLMKDHHDHRAVTAELWLRALLSRGDFVRIIDLAARMAPDDKAQRASWINALIFATRQTNTLEPLKQLLAAPHTMESSYYEVLEMEVALRSGHKPADIPLLLKIRKPLPESYVGYYQVDRLTAAGFPGDALNLLKVYEPSLDQADALLLKLNALTALGQTAAIANDFDKLKFNAKSVEVISAYLIWHPNPKVFNAFYGGVERSNLPRTAETRAAFAALFCAAGVAGDWQRLHTVGFALKEISGGHFSTVSNLEAFFRGEAPTNRVETILPALQPLSTLVMYALYERPAPGMSLLRPAQ